MALSGGADSAALLGAAAALGRNFRGLPLRALHIDHGLQAAAAEFRASCARLCDRLSVPLTIVSIDVDAPAGDSIEAAARDARYRALAAALAPRECLLTAHHREDQAETLLLQALRGAGVKGLSAMPMCRILGNGWHVRPLLEVPQSELLRFGEHLLNLKSNDPMNEDLRFDRSFLRRQIWPLLVRAGREQGAHCRAPPGIWRRRKRCWTARPQPICQVCATARRCWCRDCGPYRSCDA